MRPIGVFGGTFDPIHVGHLFIAEEAANVLGLERVLFVPAHVPPHRETAPRAAGADRLEMVKRAIAGNDRFQASAMELEREGPSYTVDTLKALREELPDHEIFFIVGADSLFELKNWHDPEGILALARIVAVERGGMDLPDLGKIEEVLPSARERITMLSGLALEVSATEVRQRLTEGRSVRYIVPDAVIEYIEARGLYRA